MEKNEIVKKVLDLISDKEKLKELLKDVHDDANVIYEQLEDFVPYYNLIKEEFKQKTANVIASHIDD